MPADCDTDVVIIGAGLGGSATAYALREAGLKVLMRGKVVPRNLALWCRSKNFGA